MTSSFWNRHMLCYLNVESFVFGSDFTQWTFPRDSEIYCLHINLRQTYKAIRTKTFYYRINWDIWRHNIVWLVLAKIGWSNLVHFRLKRNPSTVLLLNNSLQKTTHCLQSVFSDNAWQCSWWWPHNFVVGTGEPCFTDRFSISATVFIKGRSSPHQNKRAGKEVIEIILQFVVHLNVRCVVVDNANSIKRPINLFRWVTFNFI